MFVQSNSLRGIKDYFHKELSSLYSEREIKQIVKLLTVKLLKISDLDYISSSNLKFSESDLLFFRTALNRLRDQEPFQYVLGEVEFYNLRLTVDSRALIPRPETEELVHWIGHDFNSNEELNIIDVCSGSGCIAFSLKSKFTRAKIIALEHSVQACSLIRENGLRTQLDVDVFEADVLDPITYRKMNKASFDVWVSNPPYIPVKEMSDMSKNVLDYEPGIALFVDDSDPLLFYREIAEKAKLYLRSGGALYFEIHEDFGAQIEVLLKSFGFVNIELRKDLQGKTRMVKARTVTLPNETQ
ncbi:MAG: peptide chain release factor N(5)-glutamine methyltransferase [Crocinitomicaceae bacterium]|nr:peptide chain release factor N(5)-glutamine methyltransferase [Crocinitomicaceae bacterium]